MKTAAILQARTGSTRLPGKMMMPFFGNQTIPDLIIANLKKVLEPDQIILATTTEPGDDAVAVLAEKQGIRVFRGDTNDVLKRFLDAARQFELTDVIRICADNPFLSSTYVQFLMNEHSQGTTDYVTFAFPDGTPIMKAHIGLFAEIMKVSFLKDIAARTDEKLYREHVTNYVYENRHLWKTRFLPVPEPFSGRKDIRLTIDTAEDFKNISELFSKICPEGKEAAPEAIIRGIDNTPGLKERMKAEIDKNSK